MIYDCFTFFNELELLEIRLHELDSVVDKFVLVEATKTFNNKPKNLVFAENKHLFSKFLDKIVHIVVDDFPLFTDAWQYEKHQRNAIAKGIENCNPDDVIMISDVDEIPSAEFIENYKDQPGVKIVGQLMCYYFLNYVNSTNPIWAKGTKLLHYKEFTTAEEIRFTSGPIAMGGWHFSFLGGIETIKVKLESFSHQEYNNDYFKDPERLKNLILQGKDLFDRPHNFTIMDIEEILPKYVLDNLEKFEHLVIFQNESLNLIESKL